MDLIYLPAVYKDVIFFILGLFSTLPVTELEGPDHPPETRHLEGPLVIDTFWFTVLGGEGGSNYFLSQLLMSSKNTRQ